MVVFQHYVRVVVAAHRPQQSKGGHSANGERSKAATVWWKVIGGAGHPLSNVGVHWLLTFLEGRNMDISYEGMSAKDAVALVGAVCSAQTGDTQPAPTNSVRDAIALCRDLAATSGNILSYRESTEFIRRARDIVQQRP